MTPTGWPAAIVARAARPIVSPYTRIEKTTTQLVSTFHAPRGRWEASRWPLALSQESSWLPFSVKSL